MDIKNTTNLIVNAVENDKDEFVACLKENLTRGTMQPGGYYTMLKTISQEGSFNTLSTGCQAALLIYIAMVEAMR